MMTKNDQKIKIRYNKAKKYHKPFEVYTETFTCVGKDKGGTLYARERYDWVVTVVDSFADKQSAVKFIETLSGVEVI